MSALYRFRGVGSRSASLLDLQAWQQKERGGKEAVNEYGELLDSATYELRVHPPEVSVDNETHDRWTVVTVDSANRPGSLVYVVQHFTELGLRINSARVSSDGGWFVDVFYLCEANGEKVRNSKKIYSIKQMLNVYMQQDDELAVNGDETDDMQRVETTVFELSSRDRPGLLSEVTHLLTHNGCNVRSAAVWTYRGRVAFVLSVTEKGRPVLDSIKLQRLRQLVTEIMGAGAEEGVMVSVRGDVHHDRRLHQLMLEEEQRAWARGQRLALMSTVDELPAPAAIAASAAEAQRVAVAAEAEAAGKAQAAATPLPPLPAVGDGGGEGRAAHARGASVASLAGYSESGSSPTDSAFSMASEAAATGSGASGGGTKALLLSGGAAGACSFRSPKFDRPCVEMDFCPQTSYWLLNIRCRDRTKLLFDAVCTLADMEYDIYHATIDAYSDGTSLQEYYIKPRSGDGTWDDDRATLLKAMLTSSITRRFPKGLKVHVHSLDRFGSLAALTRVLQAAGLSITRAKARTYASSCNASHTFYVMAADGSPPDRAKVECACLEIGGKLVEEGQEARTMSRQALGSHTFSFSFLNRSGWSAAGSPGTQSSLGSA
eukprot:scaffold28.g7539.t1